jgi:putative membrane protein
MRRFTVISYWNETEPEWDRGDVPWIVRILVRWGIVMLGFLAAEWFVNEVYDHDRFFIDGWEALFAAAAIFVAVRAVLRPILIFLTCPLQLITLGLFIFVVNALILLFTEEVCDWFGVNFTVDGFWPAFIGALVISLTGFILSRFLRRNPTKPVRL